MESRKGNRFRPALRQRISLKLIIATGISVFLVTAVLVIYFQFSQNEVSNANTIPVLTGDQLPVEMVIGQKVTTSADTLVRNGNRYKIAKPLSQNSVSAK